MKALCLDGPLRGRFIEHESDVFKYRVRVPLELSLYEDKPTPTADCCEEVVYRLSEWRAIRHGNIFFWSVDEEIAPIIAMYKILEESQ